MEDILKSKEYFCIKNIINKSELAFLSCKDFSHYVNEIEKLLDYNKGIFKTKDNIEICFKIWAQMEEVNACALSEWEEIGYSTDFSKQWNLKYKEEAKIIIDKLNSFLSTL